MNHVEECDDCPGTYVLERDMYDTTCKYDTETSGRNCCGGNDRGEKTKDERDPICCE